MQTWDELARMAGAALIVLVALVALRLITGRRELAQMSSFDLVLLAAFGVIVGVLLVFETPALGEGVLALAILLLALQLNARNPVRTPIRKWQANFEPTLLLYQGCMLPSGIEKGRTTEEEVSAAVQLTGYQDPEHVEAIVLEPDGAMSVIGPRGASVLGSPRVAHLADVKRWRRET